MAAVMNTLLIFACLLPVFINGDTCLAPQVESKSYSTPDFVVSTETVLIGEFVLNCKNGLKNVNLYADVGGRTIPATKTSEENKYQISITDEHKNLPSGNYEVRVFDEEGFADLRKAQRSGESADSVKPLFTFNLQHYGIWNGPQIQSEFVAAIVAIVVWWMAHLARSNLMA